MARYDASARAAYVRARALLGTSTTMNVLLASPVEFDILGAHGALPLPPRCHARLKALTDAGFKLEVVVTGKTLSVAPQQQLFISTAQQRIAAGIDQRRDVSPATRWACFLLRSSFKLSQTRIPVPMGLVREAWAGGPRRPPTCILKLRSCRWAPGGSSAQRTADHDARLHFGLKEFAEVRPAPVAAGLRL